MVVVAAAAIDCAYLPTLAAVIVREIIVGRNWRNLKVAILVALLAVANVLFQVEVFVHGAPDYGLRLGTAAIVGLIMLVGGRVTPSFTHNWLKRAGSAKLPAPLDRFDMTAIAIAGGALLSWIAAPGWRGTAALLIFAAVVQAARLGRWAGERTWREPIVFILHVGYAFVPLGALALGRDVWPAIIAPTAALHAWTTGAMGTMTLAVMTRATLGHTGRSVSRSAINQRDLRGRPVRRLARVAAPLLPGMYYEALTDGGDRLDRRLRRLRHRLRPDAAAPESEQLSAPTPGQRVGHHASVRKSLTKFAQYGTWPRFRGLCR